MSIKNKLYDVERSHLAICDLQQQLSMTLTGPRSDIAFVDVVYYG